MKFRIRLKSLRWVFEKSQISLAIIQHRGPQIEVKLIKVKLNSSPTSTPVGPPPTMTNDKSFLRSWAERMGG